ECHRLPTPAFIGAAVCLALARHASAAAPGRSLYSEHALEFVSLVRAHDRLAGSRGRRDHAHADRPERTPPLALLLEFTSGVGDRRAPAVSPGVYCVYVYCH